MPLSLLNSFTLCISHVEIQLSRMLNKYYDDAFYVCPGVTRREKLKKSEENET